MGLLVCLHLIAVLAAQALLAVEQDRSPSRLRVEFTADGRCAVSAAGPAFRANITYPRRRADGRAGAQSADMRCAIPGAPKGQPIELEVVLPPEAEPQGVFPRLSWRQHEGRWVGAARLPAAPAFVTIPGKGAWRDRFARRFDVTSFGWNFYGYFVFVVVWIAAYFAWAVWMARRDSRQ